MRKTMIALMIVLPMCFVLILFSSVNIVSLNVKVAVNGIEIVTSNDEDFLVLDMADEKPTSVSAKVTPNNATDKGFTLSSSDNSVLEVMSDGTLVGKREGNATVTATSNDQGYTDSVDVSVMSSKPYDLDFALYDIFGDAVPLTQRGDNFSASCGTGKYTFAASVHPAGYNFTIEPDEGTFAEIDNDNSIFLPFSGRADFTVTVSGGVKGDIVKRVRLIVSKSGDVLINGNSGDGIVLLASGEKSTSVYVESDETPKFNSANASCEVIGLGGNRYRLDVTVNGGVESAFDATITCGRYVSNVSFEFKDFDFFVGASGIEIKQDENGYVAAVEKNKQLSLFAVPVVAKADVEYKWTVESGRIASDGEKCTFYADEYGEYELKVSAVSQGKTLVENVVRVSVVDLFFSILIPGDKNVDYAECFTIGGYRYENGQKVENEYKLGIVQLAYDPDYDGVEHTSRTKDVNKLDELDIELSDPDVAEVMIRDGAVYLAPKTTGKVTVSVAWKWNEIFLREIREVRTFAFAKDAVIVDNAPDLVKATGDGEKVVLGKDIMLGTDRDGTKLPVSTLESMLGKMRSTYNIEWYKQSGKTQDANISFVMEFKNDVYGNGHFINAENFTHCVDDTEAPLIDSYKYPLYFVSLEGDTASVAAQDNCAFLIRTDGVTLYGVNLLGCDDSTLYDNGNYDLNKLNHIGTTLDINGNDVNILNCRIRNGRNVVRIYGGNRDGNKYFIENLAENSEGTDKERIKVRIEGCHITQGREFLVKIGANRALRASIENGRQPPLRDQNGTAYKASGSDTSNIYKDLYKDEWFYSHYVMTDVTLKDSVLETSGLFAIGVESNFAGDLLYKGVQNTDYSNITKLWQMSGGTSFASVLRLEGDVRLYDWKDLDLIDSSTLIEAHNGLLRDWLKLDLHAMFEFVNANYSIRYGNLIEDIDDKHFIHGGMAFYGGGLNYSQLVTDNLDPSLKDLVHNNINISILAEADNATMQKQGKLLPLAAGTCDFNFYMYSKDSANNYAAQQSADRSAPIHPIPFFN